MGPDPYRDWLAIKTDHETPNHYELLGLAIFTGDAAAVGQAFEDRYALVRRYETGHYGDRAVALMAELSDAFKCLTNEQQRSQYDQELRETLATRETTTDVWAMFDTLVEQMSELEELVGAESQVDVPPDEEAPSVVESELPVHLPLDLAAPSVVDALDSMPVTAAASYLSPPTPAPAREKARKREVAIPVWLSVVCTFGAGLLVIGAIAAAFSLFGSRDQKDSIAQSSAAPADAGEPADGGEQVSSSTASAAVGDANKNVVLKGRLARVLIDDAGALHLLVASSNRQIEARSNDRDLIQQLADFVCSAEDAALADEVKLTGAVIDQAASFFDPEGRLRGNQGEVTVLELQSLELVANPRSGETSLTADDKQTLQSLRSVGQYTRFVATVSSPFESTSRRFQATFHGRGYLIEMPDAWRTVGVKISPGQQITLVTRTTGRYESPARGGVADLLLLEVETINQPSFQQVAESPSQVASPTVAYQTTARLALLKDNVATLNLVLQHEGRQFSITGLAGVNAGQDAFLKKLDVRDPLLVELMVGKAAFPATYQIASLTRLNDAADRVVFGSDVASKPEPKPLAESSVPKPATNLTLAGLPEFVDLPPLSSQASEALTPAIEFADLEIELASELIALDATYRFAAKKVDGAQPPRWEIFLQRTLDANTPAALVAHLGAVNNRLAFRWDDNAGNVPAGQLRNCLMKLKSGGQSRDIALRSPLRPGATGLPSEAAKFNIPIDLEDPPGTDRLSVDIDLTYGGIKIESQTRNDTAARSKRLDYKLDQPEYVEIQVTLLAQQDKSLVLHAAPRIQMGANRLMTLSTEDVDDHERRIRQSGLKAEKALAKAQSDFQKASDSYSRAGSQAVRLRFGASMDVYRKAIAANQQNLAEAQQSLALVDTLRDYVDTVQSNTQIRYRVYAEAGETRLLLVDGGYREEDAMRKAASNELPIKAAEIDGLWQLIGLQLAGRRIDRSDGFQLRLQNGRYSCQVGSLSAQGTYQIDASTASPTITFENAGQPALRQVGVFLESGVFNLTSNGMELSIAFDARGSQAGDFAAIASGGGFVSVYQRVE